MTTDLKPGIYEKLSYADYSSWMAIRHSMLEKLRRTPAHAFEAIKNPPRETDALAFGHAFHTALLEPDLFARDFYVLPKMDMRLKASKESAAALESENPGRIAVKEADARAIAGMKAAIQNHETAAELLHEGQSELSMVWNDGLTGELCKGRIDHLGKLGCDRWIIDIKTTQSAEEREFQKSMATFGYHRQLAFYRAGAMTLRPDAYRCAIVAVEKEAPYCVQVFEIDEKALEQGAREFRHHLAVFLRCRETGDWPAYGQGLALIDLPRWAADYDKPATVA